MGDLGFEYIGKDKVDFCGDFAYRSDLEHRVCEKLKEKKIKLYRLEIYSIDTDSLHFHSNGIGVFAVDIYGEHVFEFKLIPMPGCCGILVSTGTIVAEKYRGNRISYLMQELKEDLAQINNYGILYATTIAGNDAENAILDRCGWFRTSEFINPRTGNTVIQWTKILPYKEASDD